jgi:hypothetical protein
VGRLGSFAGHTDTTFLTLKLFVKGTKGDISSAFPFVPSKIARSHECMNEAMRKYITRITWQKYIQKDGVRALAIGVFSYCLKYCPR